MEERAEPLTPGDIARPRGQMRLRTLFVFTFCLVVGLTVESRIIVAPGMADRYIPGLGMLPSLGSFRWYDVLLATVATAMAIGVVYEAIILWRRLTALTGDEAPSRFALKMEIAWRVAIAALMATSLVAKFINNRSRPPRPGAYQGYFKDLPTHHLLWLAMIVVLIAAVARYVPQRVRKPRVAILLIAAFIGVAAILYLTIDRTFLVSLAHTGLSNIDRRLKFTGNRYGRLSLEDQEWLAQCGVLAACAWVAASVLLADALRRRHQPRIVVLEVALGGGLLAAAVAYCVWLARIGFPAMSPELAGAPRDSTWLLDATAVVMAMIVVTAAALRYARDEASPQSPMRVACPPQLYESWLCLATLAVAAPFFIYEFVRVLFDFSSTVPVSQMLAFSAKDPTTYLQLAIFILGLQLAWRRWRNREAENALVIHRASPARFAWAWAAVAAILSVGAPTIVAFAHSRWLAP